MRTVILIIINSRIFCRELGGQLDAGGSKDGSGRSRYHYNRTCAVSYCPKLTFFLSPQGPYLASGVMSMTGGIVLLFMGAYVINKIRWKRR